MFLFLLLFWSGSTMLELHLPSVSFNKKVKLFSCWRKGWLCHYADGLVHSQNYTCYLLIVAWKCMHCRLSHHLAYDPCSKSTFKVSVLYQFNSFYLDITFNNGLCHKAACGRNLKIGGNPSLFAWLGSTWLPQSFTAMQTPWAAPAWSNDVMCLLLSHLCAFPISCFFSSSLVPLTFPTLCSDSAVDPEVFPLMKGQKKSVHSFNFDLETTTSPFWLQNC